MSAINALNKSISLFLTFPRAVECVSGHGPAFSCFSQAVELTQQLFVCTPDGFSLTLTELPRLGGSPTPLTQECPFQIFHFKNTRAVPHIPIQALSRMALMSSV